MLKTPLTGIDALTSWSLTFSTLHARAILSTSITSPGMNPAVNIRFRRGNILIAGPTFAPREYTIQWYDADGNKVVKQDTKKVDWVGGGWHFQADEVARCIRDGKLESDIWTLEKSMVIMKVFDEVCLKDLGISAAMNDTFLGP